ncbi:MAG: HEAT repeat domain-containing protein [Myxococcales bacterium]|nr:HEAT repeat domain-containing protein [Myxococcales bacterium]
MVALGQVEDPTERRRAVPALTLALTDDDAAVRAEAAAGLGQMGELAPVPALLARLSDGDSGVRQYAAIALGTLRERAAFAPLAEALREGPSELRYQAVTSLAEIDPVAAYEPVLAALGDRDPQVVAAAAVALGTLGDGRAVAALLPLLTHADAAVRFEVAWALAQLGDGRGRPELNAALGLGAKPRALATDPHPGRALEAVEALARLGSAEDLRALGQVVRLAAAPAEARIMAARHVLAWPTTGADQASRADHASQPSQASPASLAAARADDADRSSAETYLLAALGVRQAPVRGLAVEQLSAVGGPWALPALQALGKSRRGRALAEPIADALAAIAARTQAGPRGPSAPGETPRPLGAEEGPPHVDR